MAMNGTQQNGWNAGTGNYLDHGQLNHLILGALAMVIFLFAAWALFQAYRGLPTKSVTFRQFLELKIRLVMLILLTLFFFFH